MTKLVDQRAADEARSAGDQDLHRRRVYWRTCALLAAALLLVGCDSGEPSPTPTPTRQQSLLALDREHQRLVRDYLPVSNALTGWELTFRDWRAGKVSQDVLLSRAASYRSVVARALERVRRDRATGDTRRGKRLLVTGLRARREALDALPGLEGYEPRWNRSVAAARAGLTVLQDIRDRARLIPLPEDAVS